ncbi:unnamed protein product [Psylliodes chrysocephalus]|uniref:CWF19-like protein 2 n=1 Tax=Psylliodes chrysocephalus TaxID=3402493 RepID=A0A9P0CNS3_9CUCU|nr:unnamed protein product [Psylliodes chrysocephala]
MGNPKGTKKYLSSSEEYVSKNAKSKKKKRLYSTSSSEEEIISRKKKNKGKAKKYSKEYSSSSDSDSLDDNYKHERKEKRKSESPKLDIDKSSSKVDSKLERDSWMNVKSGFATISNSGRKNEREEAKKLEREKQKYDPRKCDRELNPYWKHGGDGLPTFKKPEESDSDTEKQSYKSRNRYTGTSNWRKKKEYSDNTSISKNLTSSSSNWRKKKDTEEKDKNNRKDASKIKEKYANIEEKPAKIKEIEILYTEKDLNTLAAKLVKAEIMGNAKLIQELKEKLETARNSVNSTSIDPEDYILTQTDAKGQSKPLKLQTEYGDCSNSRKKKRLETHQGKERVRYFADDDKYSLKQMFENEKYNTGADQDKEFIKTFQKIRKNDDLDDVFSDNIRNKESDLKIDEKNKSKAISDHQKVSHSLDNCNKCIQSETMLKHLMISMGDTVFLALPAFEPLTEGHCLIVPIRHTPCATHLDENEWTDVLDVRKSLVKMFAVQDKIVIFFESAMNIHKFPHMAIECIPIDREEGDMAPIYFKKAIDESEIEWAQNKKLVSLKGRDVRKAIPKGLSYFSVSFRMEEGFAHVIEDEQLFPSNFAQEVIGGMLDLHHSKWRKPKYQKFDEQSKRVMEFSAKWKDFDCLVNY